jgi:hypothetical protein
MILAACTCESSRYCSHSLDSHPLTRARTLEPARATVPMFTAQHPLVQVANEQSLMALWALTLRYFACSLGIMYEHFFICNVS